MENDKMYAEKTYKVTKDGNTTTINLRRVKSGAFHYGNGSAVAVKEDDGLTWLWDTRYDHDVMGDFDEWCRWFLVEQCGKNITIEEA